MTNSHGENSTYALSQWLFFCFWLAEFPEINNGSKPKKQQNRINEATTWCMIWIRKNCQLRYDTSGNKETCSTLRILERKNSVFGWREKQHVSSSFIRFLCSIIGVCCAHISQFAFSSSPDVGDYNLTGRVIRLPVPYVEILVCAWKDKIVGFVFLIIIFHHIEIRKTRSASCA